MANAKPSVYDPFDLPNGKKVRFKKPSVGDIEKANYTSSVYATKLLRENELATKKEIQSIVDKDEDTELAARASINNLLRQMQQLDLEYRQVQDPERRQEIVEELQTINFSLIEKVGSNSQIYDISVEAQADKKRQQILKQLTTLNAEDGTLYWPTLEDMENETDIESYNLISIRYSEVSGIISLTDEQRELMQELLNSATKSLVYGEVDDSDNS